MEKFVVAYCDLGISNRLKCLISAMRFAEKYHRTLILCWPKNTMVNCGFSDLFDNNIVEIDIEELHALKNKEDNNERYKIIHTWRLLPFQEDELPNNFSQSPFSKPGSNIDLEYDRIPLPIRERFLTYVNRLIPKKYILEEINKFSRKISDDTVSFCIRTWTECKRSRLFNMEAVFKIMDRLDNPSFFVSCDSQEFLNKTINKYGNRILHYPKRTFAGDRASKEGMQDTLIDLFLSSKNRYIKASYISTFPEMVWWFGGCKAEVEIIPPKSYIFLYTSEGYCLFGKWHWKRTG